MGLACGTRLFLHIVLLSPQSLGSFLSSAFYLAYKAAFGNAFWSESYVFTSDRSLLVETLKYSGFNERTLNLGVSSRSRYESSSRWKWWA